MEINDEFKPGFGTHSCPDCGEKCDVKHNITGFSEYIYCSNCKKKFIRDREAIEQEENAKQFKCYNCSTEEIERDYRLHIKTKPVGDFESIEPKIVGYDESSLVCYCGNRHNGYFDVGEEIECECGRVYTLNIEEP